MRYWCYLVCVIPAHWLLTLNRSLFWILFPDLFAKHILICFMSAAHVSLVLSPLHLCVLADFEQVIVLVLLFLALFVNWTLICSMSAALGHWGYLSIILVQWLLTLNKSLFQYVYFFMWVLYIYIIIRVRVAIVCMFLVFIVWCAAT